MLCVRYKLIFIGLYNVGSKGLHCRHALGHGDGKSSIKKTSNIILLYTSYNIFGFPYFNSELTTHSNTLLPHRVKGKFSLDFLVLLLDFGAGKNKK